MSSSAASVAGRPDLSLSQALAPLCLIVFLEFLAMGLPLPVLPLHVHDTLGFGALLVGVVVGMQSVATLVTRNRAGTHADRRGPHHAATLGLALSIAAGALSALSTLFASSGTRLVILLAGRALLGLGESLVITSALAWAVALAGRERSGLVMAWIGIAMYAALAAGAPVGAALHASAGFGVLSLAAALAPALAFVPLALARQVQPVGGVRLPFRAVVGLIWLPGLGLALAAVGFGAIAAYSALYFAHQGWRYASLAMTAFGAAYIVARLAFGTFPDRFGGARVAVASVALAVVGQAGMWLATSGAMAVAFAAITGAGFSLSFPSFGVVALGQVPAQNRGVALGAYTACFDAAMGLGVPALGAAVSVVGYRGAFAVGATAAVGALGIALVLARRGRAGVTSRVPAVQLPA